MFLEDALKSPNVMTHWTTAYKQSPVALRLENAGPIFHSYMQPLMSIVKYSACKPREGEINTHFEVALNHNVARVDQDRGPLLRSRLFHFAW